MVEFAKLFDRLTFQSNTFLVECFPIFFSVFFKKSRPPASFVYCYRSFQIQKNVHFSGIRTQMVGVEGEHADHLTTTTALLPSFVFCPYHY